MARKLALSPLEGAIMKQLEDAGAEDVTTTMNAVLALAPIAGVPQSLMEPFERALRRLCSLGLVELVASDQPGYPRITPEERERVLRLGTWLSWEPNGGYWRRTSSDSENVAIARVAGKSQDRL